MMRGGPRGPVQARERIDGEQQGLVALDRGLVGPKACPRGRGVAVSSLERSVRGYSR